MSQRGTQDFWIRDHRALLDSRRGCSRNGLLERSAPVHLFWQPGSTFGCETLTAIRRHGRFSRDNWGRTFGRDRH
ncbi:hypothetical protein [Myxococcus qinghaiensis]|uniref:hypothetical protein n=1 Tax=Myxococcus qinghaiensis TaxID=2906758 RepID=UPI0020A7723C|nr:hypothetical protein [Myxococcus qinghaiensis]MCP3161603.1 hypothetical protein [Myxococcus qinghaiensis]